MKRLVVEVALDSSEFLALLNGQPGSELVAKAFPKAAIRAINPCEVVAKLTEAGMSNGVIRDALRRLRIHIISLDHEHADCEGLLYLSTRDVGL